MVVAISDAIGTRKILDIIKINPNIYIIVRTRYIRDMESLYQMGADEIVPEEFETSIEIFSACLKNIVCQGRKLMTLSMKFDLMAMKCLELFQTRN